MHVKKEVKLGQKCFHKNNLDLGIDDYDTMTGIKKNETSGLKGMKYMHHAPRLSALNKHCILLTLTKSLLYLLLYFT